MPNCNGYKISNLEKKISREVKNLGFKSEVSSNLKIANFLDITFDLYNNSNNPFNKNNDIPSYVNVNSNHPKCIIKQIPTAVNLRINRLLSSKRIFEYNKESYNEALYNSGFNKKLEFLDLNRVNKYRDNDSQHTKYRMNNTKNSNDHFGNRNYKNRNRHRKIIWFNPPFCKLTNIHISKYFVNLNDKHFPKNDILSKIFL